MREVVYVGKSIMIVQERKGELVTVIQSSGYTCDEQAIKCQKVELQLRMHYAF